MADLIRLCDRIVITVSVTLADHMELVEAALGAPDLHAPACSLVAREPELGERIELGAPPPGGQWPRPRPRPCVVRSRRPLPSARPTGSPRSRRDVIDIIEDELDPVRLTLMRRASWVRTSAAQRRTCGRRCRRLIVENPDSVGCDAGLPSLDALPIPGRLRRAPCSFVQPAVRLDGRALQDGDDRVARRVRGGPPFQPVLTPRSGQKPGTQGGAGKDRTRPEGFPRAC